MVDNALNISETEDGIIVFRLSHASKSTVLEWLQESRKTMEKLNEQEKSFKIIHIVPKELSAPTSEMYDEARLQQRVFKNAKGRIAVIVPKSPLMTAGKLLTDIMGMFQRNIKYAVFSPEDEDKAFDFVRAEN